MCTKQHQYSLCASPTKDTTKGRKRKWGVDKSELVAGKKKPFERKRRKEIRDILRLHNEGYSDNFFDSTPVRARKTSKYPITDILVRDPEVNENDLSLSQNIAISRSNSVTPVNVHHHLLASPPALSAAMKRKNADIIILRMQKSRKCRKRGAAIAKSGSSNTVAKTTTLINAGIFHNHVKIDVGNLSSEDDCYFSNTEDD